MARTSTLGFPVLLLVLGACGGARNEATVPSATTAAPTSVEPRPDVSESALRAAAKGVLACKPEAPLGTPGDCPAYVDWFHLDAIDKGQADEALVALLEDSNPVLAELAAQTLERGDHTFPKDKALAERIVAKLEGATALPLQQPLAHAAATIEPATTGLGERLVELSKKLPPEAHAEFVKAAQQKSPDFYHASTVELAKTATVEELRRAALTALFGGLTSGKEAEICELWASIAADAKAPEGLAGYAADLAAKLRQTSCSAQYDRLLKAAEARAKGRKLEAWEWASALSHLATDNPGTQPAQAKQATGLLKKLAENVANESALRVVALDGFAAADPAGAKPVLARLAKDRDAAVAKRAGELAAAK